MNYVNKVNVETNSNDRRDGLKYVRKVNFEGTSVQSYCNHSTLKLFEIAIV